MKEPLITMLQIYKPLELGVDWMNYKIVRVNDLTYHHILEKRHGGKRTLQNGAILVRVAHDYLNYLDRYYHKYYNDLNGLFKELNMTMAPPDDGYFIEVNRVLKKVR